MSILLLYLAFIVCVICIGVAVSSLRHRQALRRYNQQALNAIHKVKARFKTNQYIHVKAPVRQTDEPSEQVVHEVHLN